jgi:DNA-binding response OmpR family regulator
MRKRSIEKVLLVEDNLGDARLIREIFSQQLSRYSKLIHVESMEDAERRLSADSVDLVLLDLGLPDEQGLGAIRRVHAAAPKVPVVVMTGLDDEAVAAQALEEGVLHYFVKSQVATRGLSRPLHYDTFLKRIMKW